MNTVTRTRYQTRKLLAAKHLDDLMKIYNAGYEDAKPTLKIANKAFDRLSKPLHQRQDKNCDMGCGELSYLNYEKHLEDLLQRVADKFNVDSADICVYEHESNSLENDMYLESVINNNKVEI